MGERRAGLGVDQRLIQVLGRRPDAIIHVGSLERVEQFKQGRLIRGHRARSSREQPSGPSTGPTTLSFHEPWVWTRSGRRSEMGMQTSHPVDVAAPAASSRRRAGYQISEWVLGILGVVGTFVGAFILVGPENCCVVRYPSLSWRVGDIDPAWGYGLLVAGILSLLATVALVVRGRRHRAPQNALERS
jgi:hypothetical protein